VNKTLSYGEIPDDLTIDKPYPMGLNATDEALVCSIINQGIDSHLEAVFFEDHGIRKGKRHIDIVPKLECSMRCFLRRLVEHSDEGFDLASCIMTTLGYEWV
jgi:hypothetical protein